MYKFIIKYQFSLLYLSFMMSMSGIGLILFGTLKHHIYATIFGFIFLESFMGFEILHLKADKSL